MSDTKTKTCFKNNLGVLVCLALALAIVWIEYCFFEEALLCALENKNSDEIRNYFLIFIASAGAPFLVWRAIIASRNTVIANRDSDTNRNNQITRAYSTAIEQLGSTHLKGHTHTENIETRLGAIYTLEKIALSNKNYHQSIIEILASYVRHNSPNNKGENKKIDIVSQTILTVIARRRVAFDIKNKPIDLADCNLRHLELMDGDLSVTFLMSTDLTDAILIKTDLTNANLDHADLTDTYLLHADLTDADLTNIIKSDATELPEGFKDIVKCWSFQTYDKSTGKWIDAQPNKTA